MHDDCVVVTVTDRYTLICVHVGHDKKKTESCER